LGSIVASTNSNLTVIERLAYDPFGKRRFTNGAYDQVGTIDAQSTNRGFTGHEHLDELDFIHMNARVYDPDIGRFLSPDPTIAHPHNPQSFNRYSYVYNNPLNAIDPTGFQTNAVSSQGPSTSCNSCSLSDESIANARNNKPSTNVNPHDKQTAALPDAEKSLGQEHGKQLHEKGQKAAEIGAEVMTEGALFFAPIGRLLSWGAKAGRSLATNVSRLGDKVASLLGRSQGATDDMAKAAAALNVPGRVQSRINLTTAGMKHLTNRHLSGKANASQFSISEKKVRELLR
jgi:RHS repeat-associated protein